MDNKELQTCSCKKISRTKLFFATKNNPYFCKQCDRYIYIEGILVEAFLDSSGMALILAAFYLLALYKGKGLIILGVGWFGISIFFRLIEIYLFKIHIISAEEKLKREQRRGRPGIGTLIVLLVILVVILIYNYSN